MCYGSPPPTPRFDEYAHEKHIEHEVNFWKTALEFQKTKFASPRKAKRAAFAIYNRFLNMESEEAIFLTPMEMSQITSNLKKKTVSTSIYQTAIMEVSNLLADHFREFTSKYNLRSAFTVMFLDHELTLSKPRVNVK